MFSNLPIKKDRIYDSIPQEYWRQSLKDFWALKIKQDTSDAFVSQVSDPEFYDAVLLFYNFFFKFESSKIIKEPFKN